MVPPIPRHPARPGAFELLERPHVAILPGFRFAFTRVWGPYTPWARVRALDDVAEALERADVPRVGPPFGVYYDLPLSARDPDEWVADLGYPVPPRVRVPTDLGLRTRRLPARRVGALRYAGDVQAFPGALASLMEWAASADLELEGPLLERFHLSDALSGCEDRDVMVAFEPINETTK